jgi:predicted transcriptional regulator
MMMERILISKKKREIVRNLAENPKKIADLRKSLELSGAALSLHLKDLFECGVVWREGDTLSLTGKGEVISLYIEKFEEAILTLERDPVFWQIHDLSTIPAEFKLRINEIGNYRVIWSRDGEVLRHHKAFMSAVRSSKWTRTVASVIFPNHPAIYSEVSKRADVSVIVTGEILKKLLDDYDREMKIFVENGGEVFVNDDVRFVCITTDKVLCMGLYLQDGSYDIRCGLISSDKSAIKWGSDLFEYFRRRSRKVY